MSVPVSKLKCSVVSSEVADQVLPLDEQAGRPPVRAGDGFVGRLQVDEQPSLLRDVEHVTESDRRMAGQRCRRLLHCAIAPVLAQSRERLLYRGRGPAGRHLHRYGGDAKAARAELLQLE